MEIGAITGYVDVAQIVLYLFWIFFFGLLIYLHREDKREGYPLESSRTGRAPRVPIQGFPAIPAPKVYRLASGRTVSVPGAPKERADLALKPTAPFYGAPFTPTGDGMRDGVGPAAWAIREDHPETMIDGSAMIVPMRVASDFHVASGDLDLRGLPVYGSDDIRAGTVSDIWVDRSEPQIRYLEASVADGARKVLLPIHMINIDKWRRDVSLTCVTAAQIADAPLTASPDVVTLLEEDKITAYFAGGTLYSDPANLDPIL
jgi:photosynthetic reaction center H subunit